jgi:hypothetical protein
MYPPRHTALAVVFAAALALSACGGGGDDPPASAPTVTPEGAYSGTLTGSPSTDFQLLMLENNEFWSLYGTSTPAAFTVNGFAQGSGTASSTSYSSSNVKDFGFSPAADATLGATYNATAGTVNGIFTVGASLVSFSGNRIPAASYNYDTPALVAPVAGAWSLGMLAGQTMAVTIQPDGSLTGSTAPLTCNFTGSLVPRPSGKNVFNVAITFGAGPCVLASQNVTGIAISYPLTGGGRQLMVAVTNVARTEGIAAFGVRP